MTQVVVCVKRRRGREGEGEREEEEEEEEEEKKMYIIYNLDMYIHKEERRYIYNKVKKIHIDTGEHIVRIKTHSKVRHNMYISS